MKHAHIVQRKDTATRNAPPRLTPAARNGWRLGSEAPHPCEQAESRRLVLLMESVA
jgi:hypothetical protein